VADLERLPGCCWHPTRSSARFSPNVGLLAAEADDQRTHASR
jgi:hypothetical protein